MGTKRIKCKDTGETAREYKDYLKTQHWKSLRERVAKAYSYTCNNCGVNVSQGYEIHHLTYKRVGNEKMDDLVCLCRNCHQKETERIKQQKEENKRLQNAPFIEKLHRAKDLKTQIRLVLNARKEVRKLFQQHFDRFLKDVEKLENKK